MNVKERRTYALSRQELIEIVADHLCISLDDCEAEVLIETAALGHPQPVFWLTVESSQDRTP